MRIERARPNRAQSMSDGGSAGEGQGAHGLPARICTAAVLLLLPALHWVRSAPRIRHAERFDRGYRKSRSDVGPDLGSRRPPHRCDSCASALRSGLWGQPGQVGARLDASRADDCHPQRSGMCNRNDPTNATSTRSARLRLPSVAITVLAGGWYLGFRVVGRQAESFRSRPWRFVGLAASALLALGFSSAIALAVFAILFSG
jgi:hypothetical protein